MENIENTTTDLDESTNEDATTEQDVLSEIDARILGCLMEKQQTTPDQYPLTLNSLVLACNQKSNREPKMSLTEGDVGHCLRELESKGLVRIDIGSRAYRYEHSMTKAYLVDKPLQAVLTVMMVRGPQTINELYTRTQRTNLFTSASDIENALERLTERAEPLVKLIPRQAGQREDRYAHLLCGEPKIEVTSSARSSAAPSAAPSSAATSSAMPSPELEARVAELENQVQQLQATLAELIGD